MLLMMLMFIGCYCWHKNNEMSKKICHKKSGHVKRTRISSSASSLVDSQRASVQRLWAQGDMTNLIFVNSPNLMKILLNYFRDYFKVIGLLWPIWDWDSTVARWGACHFPNSLEKENVLHCSWFVFWLNMLYTMAYVQWILSILTFLNNKIWFEVKFFPFWYGKICFLKAWDFESNWIGRAYIYLWKSFDTHADWQLLNRRILRIVDH